MSKTERINAKPQILQAALEIFALKGYDGARMDEIAAHAGLPKSLIYYHYKGKAHLLEALIEGYYEKYEEFLNATLGEDEKVELGARAFLRDNRQLTRVVLIESLKENNELPSVFRFVEGLIQREAQVLGRTSESISKRMLAEFFLNVIPRAMFSCYGETWARHFQQEPQAVSDQFHEVMTEMHRDYLSKLF